MNALSNVQKIWAKATGRTNVVLAVGFACASAWLSTMFLAANSESVISTLVSKPPHGICIPTLAAASLACVFFFIAGSRGFFLVEKTVKPVFLGLAMALLGAAFFIPVVMHGSVHVAGNVFVALSGVLASVHYLLWMRVFGSLSAQEMFITLLVSQVLACAINAILSTTIMYTVLVASVVLPVVSTLCLRVGQKCGRAPRGKPEESLRDPSSISGRLAFKLAAMVFVWGAVDHQFRSGFDAAWNSEFVNDPYAIAYQVTLLVVLVVALGAAYALFVRKEHFRFSNLYRMIFLMGLASILLLPSTLFGQISTIEYVFSVIVHQLVFLFMWIICASMFRDTPHQAPRMFGLVYGAWSFGSLGGALLSSSYAPLVSAANVHLVVLAAVMVVSIAYTLVFTENDANTLVSIVSFKRHTPFKLKCSIVAQRYGLSSREAEIALLIAQGRDSAHIEQRLFISRSTVQTHRMHLYRKLDIHNRQELLDIIERAGEGGPAIESTR
ncbi:MAG: helix-turn-helix transcriptional regulator [Gordonibacter sp.]